MTSCRAAIDLGAGSGRIFCGTPENFEEIHRFPNTWIFDETLASIREGLAKLAERHIDSVSCDSWAQDFGLLGKDGEVLYAPVSYLSGRADAVPDRIAATVAEEELFRLGGIRRINAISTLAQWKYMTEEEPEVLDRAARLLPVADLVNAQLCGRGVLNFSLASAAGLLTPDGGRRRNTELLHLLRLNPALVDAECPPPDVIGTIVSGRAAPPELAGVPVISGIGHDTAAAFYGCGLEPGEVVLSLGSWGMLGAATAGGAREDSAVIGIVPGRCARIVSCQGMRLLQHCVAEWRAAGCWPGYPAFDAEVADSDFPGVFPAAEIRCPPPPGGILEEIARHCTWPPRSPAEFGRAVCRSVATAIVSGVETLERAENFRCRQLKVCGGGLNDANLMAELRRQLKTPVVPICREAAVRGNLLMQERIAANRHLG